MGAYCAPIPVTWRFSNPAADAPKRGVVRRGVRPLTARREPRQARMANPPSANRFKAVFFDLDGTIVDIHGPLFNAARATLEQIGHTPPLTRERYRDAIANGDFYLGLPDDQRDAYMRLAYLNLLLEVERIDTPAVLAHVPETLAELKRRDYATAIITSRPGDAARLIEKLARVGLARYFDQIITQSSFSMRALDKSRAWPTRPRGRVSHRANAFTSATNRAT